MSSLTQAKKKKKQRDAERPTGVPVVDYETRNRTVNPANEPRLSSWLPDEDENQNRRFWQAPKIGDIVHCRFPDFMRDVLESSQRKLRPAMVVGVQQYSSGEVVALVAYGTSQINEEKTNNGQPVLVHGLAKGELLVEAKDIKNGLELDTKFCMRKVLKLPFDNDWFAPFPKSTYGVHPKRGRFDLDNQINQMAMNYATHEAKSLGSLLDGDGPSAKLRRPML